MLVNTKIQCFNLMLLNGYKTCKVLTNRSKKSVSYKVMRHFHKAIITWFLSKHGTMNGLKKLQFICSIWRKPVPLNFSFMALCIAFQKEHHRTIPQLRNVFIKEIGLKLLDMCNDSGHSINAWVYIYWGYLSHKTKKSIHTTQHYT